MARPSDVDRMNLDRQSVCRPGWCDYTGCEMGSTIYLEADGETRELCVSHAAKHAGIAFGRPRTLAEYTAATDLLIEALAALGVLR